MNVIVCVKQVPDTETKVKLSPDSQSLDFTGVKWIVNPYDEFAIEESLKFKAANPSAIVTVVSMGPKNRVVESLRTALAMGADEAVVIDGPESADPSMTAKALSKYISQAGAFRLVYFGKMAIDDNASSVAQMVAEQLKVPHATVVSKIEYSEGAVTVEREVEGGTKEILQLHGPAVIAATKGLNTPRYASLPGIMKAKKKAIKEVSLSDLGISNTDAKTLYSSYELPPERPGVKMISGDPQGQSTELVKLLREEAKVI